MVTLCVKPQPCLGGKTCFELWHNLVTPPDHPFTTVTPETFELQSPSFIPTPARNKSNTRRKRHEQEESEEEDEVAGDASEEDPSDSARNSLSDVSDLGIPDEDDQDQSSSE